MPTPSTAQTILTTAQELVQLRGYNGFSYRDLAERIGIKTASIHYHFPSKNDLGLALIKRYRENFATLLNEIDERTNNAIEGLESYVAIFASTFEGDHRMCLCGSLALDINTLTEPVRAEVKAYLDDNTAWLTRVLREGQAEGTIRKGIDLEQTARTVLATLEGAMLTARPFADPDRLQATGAWLIETIRA